jgi:hypothetical protein
VQYGSHWCVREKAALMTHCELVAWSFPV